MIPRLSHASLLHVCFVASSLLVLIYLRGFFSPPVRQLHLFLPSHGIFPVFPMPEAATVGFSYAFTSPPMAMPLCTPDPGKMPGSRGSDLCCCHRESLASPAGHCLGELGRTDPQVRETWRGLGSALSCQRPAELSLGCGVWEQQAACFLLGPANGGAAVSLKAFGVGISLGSQPWEQRVLPGTRVLSLG